MASTQMNTGPALAQFGGSGDLPAWLWAAMHTATRMALRNPGAIPIVNANTADGCVVVMDSMDFRYLIERLTERKVPE
jgi:hypothetical protein